MDDGNKFVIQDSYGIKLNAEFIMKFNVDDVEYILYNIDDNSEKLEVYVGRVIYNQEGNETIIGISDREEEEKIFSIVDNMINKVR